MGKEVKKGLNHQQSRFCVEYLKDYNATQAAIRAEYSKKTAYSIGQHLLKKVEIQKYISDCERQFENRIGISKEKILKELALIGFSSMDEYVEIDDNGIVVAKVFTQMPSGAVRAIKKIKEKRVIRTEKGTKDNPDGDEILDSTFEFELYDKPNALINMGKELGMFKEKHELNLNIPITVIIRKFGDRNKLTE